ncbi:MAG: hypothetical protein FWH02_00105 [Oscillospiraceae bacterium]|nr:hypothetical protein [Oscillospiraceae bacterium]
MYFEKPGKENTRKTIELALKTAKERGIGHIVIASNTGESAMPLANNGVNVVCVTHVCGFSEKGKNELSEENRAALQKSGVNVLTASHVLSGVERGLSTKLGGVYPAEIMAHTLRMFGQGTKVCVEISIMALDAGLIPYGEKIIAIGGTGRGADTAVIITPAHAQNVLETRVHEFICKPL